MSEEVARIEKAYTRRDFLGKEKHIWNYFNPAYLFHNQYRDRSIIQMLSQYGIGDLSDKKILDVGCGMGTELIKMVLYGAYPKNLSGIDLIAHRIETAKKNHPGICFQRGNAEVLPFRDDTFDIVMQFTCFSSVLDLKTRQNMALEMIRVLKPRGIILWFDMRPTPVLLKILSRIRKLFLKGFKQGGEEWHLKSGNLSVEVPAEVSPMSLNQIQKLFEGCKFFPVLISLNFPWGGISRFSWCIAAFFQAFPFFRTHWLVGITKRSSI